MKKNEHVFFFSFSKVKKEVTHCNCLQTANRRPYYNTFKIDRNDNIAIYIYIWVKYIARILIHGKDSHFNSWVFILLGNNVIKEEGSCEGFKVELQQIFP